MIPKKLHVIWIGDESRRPDNCIATWRERHPDWTIRIWGNHDLAERGWTNAAHMRQMARRELNGVADMMRWEILYDEGGVVVDADSVCLRRLDDWLLECEAFACWEHEIERPGLIAAGYVGSVAANPFIGQIVLDIQADPAVCTRPAWESVGPLRLTESHRRYGYRNLTVLPSHFFIPRHYGGAVYTGDAPVYADQLWGSTHARYEHLHRQAAGVFRPGAPARRQPSISAVVLPGSGERSLTVRSLLEQDYPALEVLVPGADPREWESDPRVRVLGAHAGASYATLCDAAVAQAAGQYLLWLHAGDFVHSTALASYGALAAGWPEAGLFYGDLAEIGRDGKLTEQRFANLSAQPHLLAHLLHGGKLPRTGIMNPRALLQRVGPFRDGLGELCAEEMWMRLAADGMLVHHIRGVSCIAAGRPAPSDADFCCLLDLLLQRHELEELNADLDWRDRDVAQPRAVARLAALVTRFSADAIGRQSTDPKRPEPPTTGRGDSDPPPQPAQPALAALVD